MALYGKTCANYMVRTKILLEGLDCYEDNYMKAYDIKK